MYTHVTGYAGRRDGVRAKSGVYGAGTGCPSWLPGGQGSFQTDRHCAELLTMAKPTSAFFRAGPSFVPSPVTATTCRWSPTVLSMMPGKNRHASVGPHVPSEATWQAWLPHKVLDWSSLIPAAPPFPLPPFSPLLEVLYHHPGAAHCFMVAP